ncbi:7-carboxy-7-deazaguanine synthase QueE [Qipengyuania sp. ASV99]|uniref:7-carboxy-7-deazaguanine synthase QueE n=1 Tax=Qipengyuania sp. ASV99 TaxID=3399681 RepID=UPI003A4C6665
MAALTLATDDTGGPEIFASLQGEGPSAGMPVAFIRTSRCNLACVWCDTPYTWHFEGDDRSHRDGTTFARKDNQVTLSPQQAAAQIAALRQNRLVITGGEPLLQAGALAEMLEHLPHISVEIETNGTVKPPARIDIRVDQYNVSPKLAHSGNAGELALIPERIDEFAADPRAYFKFVIGTPDDVDEVIALRRKFRLAPDRVFLMAEGTDSNTLRNRQKWLSVLCLEHGFRLSDRLHIHLYGDTRAT